MVYKIEEKWLKEYRVEEHDSYVEDYLQAYHDFIQEMPLFIQRRECISGFNRMNRSAFWTCSDVDLEIEVGDICYADFGHSYLNESAFQHFALVVKIWENKAFVIPMTSNAVTVKKAQKGSRQHLYYVGKVDGLDRETTLFLNDARFINSSRIISVNAHLDPKGASFQEILSFYKRFFVST